MDELPLLCFSCHFDGLHITHRRHKTHMQITQAIKVSCLPTPEISNIQVLNDISITIKQQNYFSEGKHPPTPAPILFPLTLAPPPYVIPKNEKREGATGIETDTDRQADKQTGDRRRQTDRTLSSACSLGFQQDAYLSGK